MDLFPDITIKYLGCLFTVVVITLVRRMLPAVREKIEELAAGVRMNYLPEGS